MTNKNKTIKIVLAPDSFKGTLSARQVTACIAEKLHLSFANAKIVSLPISDGGEGLIDCLSAVLPTQRMRCAVSGPLGAERDAEYLIAGDLAVIEMAQAAGLTLIDPPDVMHATTYGVGQMIADAEKRGAKRVLLGLGGSATNDAGCGMAAALGCRFWNGAEYFVPVGGTLRQIERIEYAPTVLRVTALCDVKNPLYGESGAAYVYGRQKGAREEDLPILDEGLRHVARLLRADGKTWDVAGAGAAGGLGAGVTAFLGGDLAKGIDAVLDAVSFDDIVKDADLVVTGEGRLDSQSFQGKVIDGIVKRCPCPVVAVVGQAQEGLDYRTWGLSAVFATAKHQKTADFRKEAHDTLSAAADDLIDWIERCNS